MSDAKKTERATGASGAASANALALRPTQPGALSTELVQAAAKAADFARRSVPENTKRAYAADWATFTDWCRRAKVPSMPADPRVVASFIAAQASTLKPSSIRRRLAAIAKMHSVSGHPNPCTAEPVPSTMRGIEATLGIRPAAKAPATLDVVARLVSTFRPDTLEGLRNRALILVGYAAALRRSELVGIAVADLTWSDRGVEVLIRKSKTDQAGAGIVKAVPFMESDLCAARALKGWLVASGIDSGPVFRGLTPSGVRPTALADQAVALIIKSAAENAGLDPKAFSGHSLRAGHVTQARASGVADSSTMATTGHRRVETLDVYDRRNNAFERTSAGSVLGGRKG